MLLNELKFEFRVQETHEARPVLHAALDATLLACYAQLLGPPLHS